MDERAERLTQALAEVLDAIELHEERRDRPSFASPEISEPMNITKLDELQAKGEFMLADPIGFGLRKTVRKVGEVLARDFPNEMETVADTAAIPNREAADAGRSFAHRTDIIDKHWDGLQRSGGGVWVA